MVNEQTLLLPQNRAPRAQTRRSSCTRCLIAFTITLFFSVSTIFYLRWRRAVVPEEIDHDFGIGFDLTVPYGTAAISFPNGTIVNVARIEALYFYQKMVARLSLESSRHINPPCRTLPEYFRDQPRQLLCEARKAAGLPASLDVAQFAYLINALRSSVEIHLGRKISGAVPTVPHMPALYLEDLQDAFEYLRLIYIPARPYMLPHVETETGHVYAGNGFGLCTNYTDRASCTHEVMNPPNNSTYDEVLSVSYTRGMLTSALATTCMSSISPPSHAPWAVADTSLGWNNRLNNPNDDYYWAAVRDAIIGPYLRGNEHMVRQANKVLVYGECALDEKFQQVMREVVDTVLVNKPEIFSADPVYSAARGAAEMAKRVQWFRNHNGPYD